MATIVNNNIRSGVHRVNFLHFHPIWYLVFISQCFLLCYGQTLDSLKQRKNAIGIGMTNTIRWLGSSLPKDYHFLFNYKRYYHRKSFRSGFTYEGNFGWGDNKIFRLLFYLGNQWMILRLVDDKLRFYAGADGIVDYGISKSPEANTKNIKIGISPVVGGEYHLCRVLLISLESDVFLYYSKIRYKSIYNSIYSNMSIDGWFFNQFRPLGISLFYMF